jgi:hypothetical protein
MEGTLKCFAHILKPRQINYRSENLSHLFDVEHSVGKGKVIPLQARCGPEGG